MDDEIDLKDLSPAEWLRQHRIAHGYREGKANTRNDWHLRAEDPDISDMGKEFFGNLNDFETDDALMQIMLSHIKHSSDAAEEISKIYFGFFPTSDFRGRAITTTSGEKIVLLHHGLLRTYKMITLAVAYSLEKDGKPEFQEDFGSALNFCADLGRMWNDEFAKVKIYNPFRSEIPKSCWDLGAILYYSCMTFILGHEIGHILNKHPGYTKDSQHNHLLEYEADAWGAVFVARFVLEEASKIGLKSVPYALSGPYIALAGIAALSDSPGESHPSASMRLALISGCYKDFFQTSGHGAAYDHFNKIFGEEIFKKADEFGHQIFQQYSLLRPLIRDMEDRIKRKSIFEDGPFFLEELYTD